LRWPGWLSTFAPIDGHLPIAAPRRPALPDHTPASPFRHRPARCRERRICATLTHRMSPPQALRRPRQLPHPCHVGRGRTRRAARRGRSGTGPCRGPSLLLRRDRGQLLTLPARNPNSRPGRRTTNTSGSVRQTTTSRGFARPMVCFDERRPTRAPSHHQPHCHWVAGRGWRRRPPRP
jgi:hypothetical protein